MRKGMKSDAADLIRVVSALGEIKKKKEEKKESGKNFRDDDEGIFADTSSGSKHLKN